MMSEGEVRELKSHLQAAVLDIRARKPSCIEQAAWNEMACAALESHIELLRCILGEEPEDFILQ